MKMLRENRNKRRTGPTGKHATHGREPKHKVSGVSKLKSALLLLCATIQLLPVTAISQPNAIPPELIRYADIVLYNGQVLTADADENFTIAQHRDSGGLPRLPIMDKDVRSPIRIAGHKIEGE